MRWFDLIRFQTKLSPDEPAVIFPGGMATYGKLVECVENASQHVLRAGFVKGDIVAIEIRHPLLHLVVILALHRCGIASITMQTAHLLQESKLPVTCLLSDRYQGAESAFKPVLVTNDWLTAPANLPVLPVTGFDSQDDVCRLVLSSGTTGTPKVIAVSERTLQSRFNRAAITHERGRCLSMMGFSTLGGYQTLMTTLALGGSVCFAGAPEDVLQAVSLFQVTFLIAAPFQISTLLEAQKKNALQVPALRQVFLAGGVLASSLIAEVRAQLCSHVICAYGSTELGIVAYGTAASLRGIDGATGFVMPGEVIEIVDKEDGPVDIGNEGFVRIKCQDTESYFVSTPDDAVFRNGFFYPGDTGRLLPDGILVITGRTDEIINRGGDKAAPELIEEVIRKIPQIADAAVFAVPGTSQIWAAVVCKEKLQEKEVLDACRAKLAGLTPDRLFMIDRIPRNDMGKIIREDMKKIIMRKLSWSIMS